MQGGAPSSPPQFNSQQASRDQTASNMQTAAANAYLSAQNQYTPWGNLIYKETGQRQLGDGHGGFYQLPEFQVTTELSPQQQDILNRSQGLQSQGLGIASNVLGQVQGAVGTPVNFGSMPSLAALPTDQSAYRDQAYNALLSRSNQDIDRQVEAQKIQLMNQGLQPGTDAFNNALLPWTRATVDASNQALINSTGLAGQNIQQAQSIYDTSLQNRQQAINEYLQKRNQPLMDYQSLLGLSGGVQMPQWAPSTQGQVAPTDTMSPAIANYQGQINAYNQGYGANNAMMGGMFGLGGSVLGGLARAPGIQKFMGIG